MSKGRQRIAMILVTVVLFTSIIPYLPSDLLTAWAFHLNFESTGDPSHPNLRGSYGGDTSYFFCLNKGAKAKSEYDYTKRDVDVNYSDGTPAQKRLFWAYIGAWGSYDENTSLSEKFGKPGSKISINTAKEIAWSKGNSSAGSAWVESMANDGFMSLANIPPGCKSPNDIFKVVSQYTSDTPLWIGKIQSGPGVIDKQKLYDIAGLNDWDTFRKYCSVSTDTSGAIAYTDADGLWWAFLGEIGGVQRPVSIKVTYDPSVFRVLEVTGSLEYFECGEPGSQQLYRAKGDVKESNPTFYISTTSVPGSNPPGGSGSGGTGGELTKEEITVELYEHTETFESNYNVELNKYDYETGHPLEKSTWQLLETFDAGQLSSDETDGGIVEEKMREAPTTWTDWLVFDDDMETDESGYISHSDHRYYDFSHQYCDGHPIPPEPEIEEGDGGGPGDGGGGSGGDGSGGEENDAMAEYEALMEEWQAAVDECQSVADSSGGTFHHWECGGEDTPSEEEAFESSGCKEARDSAYESFINLEYSYTFRETNARDGYILHGQNGHPDDVPIEIMTTAASEAGQNAKWTSSSNEDIVVSGYLRNMAPSTKDASESLSNDENELPQIKTAFNAPDEETPKGPGYAIPELKGPGYMATATDAIAEEPALEMSESYEMSPFQELVNRLLRFFGLPEYFVEEQGATVKMTVRSNQNDEDDRITSNSNAAHGTASNSDAAYGTASNSNATHGTASDSNASYENDGYGYMTMDLEWDELENLDATPSNAAYSFSRSLKSSDDSIAPRLARSEGGYINPDSATTDSQPEADKGPDDRTAHRFVVYDHRVPGQIHFNKRDMTLAAGENAAYHSYGDSQGDATLEGAVYGLFAADDIYGPDTRRDGDGRVTGGTGILFEANDLVAVAATDKNGDGSFLTITEKPHSTYHYKTGQIEYSGKTYPKNLYVQDGYVKTYPQEDAGRIYRNNEALNGDCWIGRPLLLGNYYIKELTRSEGYELSITGKDMAISNAAADNRPEYGETEDAKSAPKGSAWITSQLSHAVTFASGNDAYGNRENLLNVEITSNDAVEGYSVVFDGLPDHADFYYNGVTITPVTVQVPDGGSWVDAAEAPLYETAKDNTVFKRTIDGELIEKPGAIPSIPVSYRAIALEAGKLPSAGTITASDPSKYQAAFTDSMDNIHYVKYELEQMMRSIGMKTPKAGNRYSELNAPVYDIHTTVNGKEVFGMPEVSIEISGATTNQSVIDTLLDYYIDNAVFTYGGLQKLEYKTGKLMATIVVGMIPSRELLYETDNSGNIAAAYLFRLNETYGRYVIRKYTGAEINANKITSATGTKYQIQVTPDFTVNDTGIPSDRLLYGSDTDRYLCYSAGETLYDYWYKDGSGNWIGHAPLRRKVYQPDYKEETIQEEQVTASKVPRVNTLEEVTDPVGSTFVIYDNVSGQYTLHAGTRDANLAGTKVSSFTAALPNGGTVVTQADIDKIGDNNVWGYKAGDSLNHSEYLIRVSGAGAGVFTSKDFDKDKTYIRNQRLIYNGNHDVSEDGNTKDSPNPVLERAITQQIKVTKNIDKSSYENVNSYSKVHEDWYTKLFGGFLSKDTEARKIDNFRFKVYLKSNLERLYRDEHGSIVWQDWKGAETDILLSNTQFPALVPKIHTKAPHKPTPLYLDSDDAILANDSLYGYTDGQIHDEQNPGYTSVLEMADRLVEDGAGTRTIRTCNYDKFFDALAAANHDKWDDAAPAYTSWQPIGNEGNRAEDAIDNARASDMVRQFAIDWYLEDEIAKLVRPVTAAPEEQEHAAGDPAYTDETYDQALSNAIKKADNYLKPFFAYDLDEIYSIGWDSAAAGGEDADLTTLTADTLYGDNAAGSDGYYFAASKYLPYGTYVIAEQQPRYAELEDFKNRHYQTDRPKEVTLPSVYADYAGSQASPEVMSGYYQYSAAASQARMEQKYHIRFNKEDPHIIRGRNADGDFEVYKYGMDLDTIKNGAETAGPGDYYALSQNEWRPYKDYYNVQDDRTTGSVPYYLSEGLSGRTPVSKYYRYSSVSEHPGVADAVPFPGAAVTEDNPTGTRYQDHVAVMKGNQTAYDGNYAAMLVPWTVTASDNSVTEIADSQPAANGESSYKGFAYSKFRNRFYAGKLRLEKLDSETHENILHDDAIFNIYAAERDDGPGGTGQVKFYEEDTTIAGSQEFLTAMGAGNITPFARNALTGGIAGAGELYSGRVPAGTPVCKETEQIIMTDEHGNKTGEFRSFTTTRDGRMKDKDTNSRLVHADQNTGYLETPRPLGAGVYVLCEIKPPSGYVRTKPIPVEVYSDTIAYYKEGNRDTRIAAAVYDYPSDHQTANENKPRDLTPMARVNVENTPIKLTVEKVKESSLAGADTTADKTVTYQVSGRVDGSLTRIGNNPSYEYAYENGDYLGYAWQKGTLEYLNARKAAGETVDIVYHGRTFAGYGYVTRKLETADDVNPYVTGAVMTLFEAVELTPSGDSEDHAYEGLEIERSAAGNISRMYIKQGHAGSSVEFVEEAAPAGDHDGSYWTAKTVERGDTDILYYDLDHLEIFAEGEGAGGKLLYGFNKNHVKVPIDQLESDKAIYEKTDSEPSIFAFKGGVPYLEFVGGDFTNIVYSLNDKSLTVESDTVIYHIDRDGNRDAEVDPHTGMAYVRQEYAGAEKILVWPIKIARDESGNIIARDKITTSRIATVGENRNHETDHAIIEPANNSGADIPTEEWPSYTHTETGYISGTWESEGGGESHRESTLIRNETGTNRNNEVLVNDNNGSFSKSLNPVYNKYGLAEYYQRSEEIYEKGTDLYDRNNDPVRYRDTDKLERENEASYTIELDDSLHNTDTKLYHRKGESYILENTWVTSDQTPNDPFQNQMTDGQPDILKRVPAGTYIMEELKAPDGYLKAMPQGIPVEEIDVVPSVRAVDKTTKIELSKVDSTDNYQCKILDMEQRNHQNNPTVIGTAREEKARYSHNPVSGAALALFKAGKIYTSDTSAHPKGWYLKKRSPDAAPFSFSATSGTVTNPHMLTARWTTGSAPIYLEGIPEGYYILEEQSAPSGFVKSRPLELYVTNTAEVQLFSLPNDHTKLEVEKYTWENGKKMLQNGAGFTLYEAKTDDAGNVIYENGIPQYHPSNVIDTWTSNDATDFTETLEIPENAPAGQPAGLTGFITEFETMYRQYGAAPDTSIRWSVKRQAVKTSASEGIWYMEDGRRIIEEEGQLLFPDGVGMVEKQKIEESWKLREQDQVLTWLMDKSAHYVSHTQIDSTVSSQGGQASQDGQTSQGGQASQASRASQVSRFPTSAVIIYETDDKQVVRITIYQEEITRRGRDFTFEYQFDYRQLSGVNARACSYITTEGIRRLDYLPVGANYVLVETTVPAGYEKADDKLIPIQSTRDIQRYSVENKTEELFLSKSWLNNGTTRKELSGATLALYRAAPDGTFRKDAAYLVDRWETGEDGTYGELDFINGHIPEGYQKGDLKPHGIRGLEEGIYYLAELKSPPYYTRFTPTRFEYKRTKKTQANRARNELPSGPSNRGVDRPTALQLIRAINEPVTGRLEIMKQSASGLPLTGVLLEVSAFRPGDREAIWSSMVSDRDGVIRLDKLPVGEPDETGQIIPYTYRVTEILPPEGYKVNTEVITFRFQPDNNGDSYAPAAQAYISFTIRDEKTKLYIEKKDFDSHTQSVSPFIEGALLAIYEVHGRDGSGNWLYDHEKDKKEVWRTTKAEERHLVEGLAAGRTYLLKELEAPPGYRIAEPLLFTVSQDGRNIENITNQLNLIQIQGDSVSGRSVTVKGRYAARVEMTISDIHGQELERWLSDGGGHTLTASETVRGDRLYLLDEHTIYSDGSDLITSRVLRGFYFDEHKTCHINDRTVSQVTESLLSQDNTPILSFNPKEYFTEKTAEWNPAQTDAAYQLKETTVYSDGQTCVSSQWSFSINDHYEIHAMTLYDRKNAPLIQKIDATTGHPLSHASLQLEDAQGTILETWLTDQSPYEIKTPLSPETIYCIRETQAPPGYQQLGEREMISFCITDLPGTITPLSILVDNYPEPVPPPEEPDIPDKPQVPDHPKTPNEPKPPFPPVIPPVEDLIPPFPFPEALPPKTGLILAFYEPSYRYPGGLIFRRPGKTPGRGYPRPRTGDDTPWLLYLAAFTTSILGILFLVRCRKKKDNWDKGHKMS